MKPGWEVKKISDFAKTSAGGTPKKSEKSFYKNGTIPWLMSGEVGKRDILESKKFISEEGLNNSSAKLFPRNSVLVAMYGATAGEVGILRFESSTNQAVCAIFPNENYETEYLYYYLLLAKEDLVKQAIGNAQPNISQTKIKNLEIPLPPLEEQRRIVALLDQAFEGLDRARANTETNLESCDKFTVSVLERFVGDKLPGWSSGSLNEVASILAGGDVDKKRLSKTKTKEHRVPIYTNGEKNLGLYGFTNEARVFEPTVTVSARGTIGFAVIRNEPFYPAVRLICVTPAENLNIKYLYYYIRSKTVDQSGTSIPQLTVPMMRKFEIFYPDLMEQERISSELEEVENRIGDIRNKVVEKLDTIENLRQSLLAKAFAGELT